MKSSPAWTLAQRYSPKAALQGPGPGSYDLTLPKAGGFSLGSSQRSHIPLTTTAPGPGTYPQKSSTIAEGSTPGGFK